MAQESTPLRILTADDIWAAKDIEERTVEVPQWGGAVRIRTFSKRQFNLLMSKAQHKNARTGQMDTDNELLEALAFTEGLIEPKFTLEDYERLIDKSAAAMTVITKAILDASGFSEQAVAEAKKSLEPEPNGQIRVSPGARAEDDAG